MIQRSCARPPEDAVQISDLPDFKRIRKKMRKLAKKNGWKVRDVKLAKFKTSDLRGLPTGR